MGTYPIYHAEELAQVRDVADGLRKLLDSPAMVVQREPTLAAHDLPEVLHLRLRQDGLVAPEAEARHDRHIREHFE